MTLKNPKFFLAFRVSLFFFVAEIPQLSQAHLRINVPVAAKSIQVYPVNPTT